MRQVQCLERQMMDRRIRRQQRIDHVIAEPIAEIADVVEGDHGNVGGKRQKAAKHHLSAAEIEDPRSGWNELGGEFGAAVPSCFQRIRIDQRPLSVFWASASSRSMRTIVVSRINQEPFKTMSAIR